MRAYRRAREWVSTAPAAEIAQAEQALFPTIAPPARPRQSPTISSWAAGTRR